MAWDGRDCPDGADCPSQVATTWGMRITVGRLVTDPQVLSTLDVPPGQVAIETPEQLWENTRDADRLSQVATIPGMRITLGTPVTDPEVLALLGLPPGEVAVETPEAPWEEP